MHRWKVHANLYPPKNPAETNHLDWNEQSSYRIFWNVLAIYLIHLRDLFYSGTPVSYGHAKPYAFVPFAKKGRYAQTPSP